MRRLLLVFGLCALPLGACTKPVAAKAGVALTDPQVVTVLELSIEGMHCAGCVDVISEALVDHDGVLAAEVDREGGRARVGLSSQPPTVETLIATIYDLGYDAKPVEH